MTSNASRSRPATRTSRSESEASSAGTGSGPERVGTARRRAGVSSAISIPLLLLRMAEGFGFSHEAGVRRPFGKCENGEFAAYIPGGRGGPHEAKQGGAGMKRLLMLPVAALAAVLVVVAAGAATQTVQVTKNGFTPQTSTVSVGDTVTWHNADTGDHQIVADDGSFASPVLHSDQSYSHTFTSAGTEKYHDAFAKTHTGTITITAPTPAPSITMSSGRSTIVYGSSTELNGTISSNLASEPVTLTAQAYGKSAQSIDQVTTTSSGDFQFGVTPTIRTSYQSHWRTADSQTVTVNVAPLVGFSRSGNVFIAKATSDLSYSGHFVWVQRHYGYGWKSVKRVFLGSNSRAVFRMTLPRGRSLLRLVMPTGQAGAGYVSGLSRTISVLRGR